MSAAIPGPRGIGVDFVRSASSGGLVRYLEQIAHRYGPVSAFRFGTRRIVVVDDAALIERILVSQQHDYVRDTGAVLVRELVGEGLLTTEDPMHLARRRLMQPAFHRARVARYAETIVAETERVIADWNGEPFDAGAAMARLTLGAVGAALFGADLRDEATRVANVLASVLQRGTSLGAIFALAAPWLGPLHRIFPRRASILFPRERAELQAIVEPIVRARVEARAPCGDDLLSLLLDARDDGGGRIDEAGLVNELVMLILAGHETTANALTWTWYLLAQHPVIERRLHDELDAVLDGRTPTIDDVAKLPFTASVFDEALRLYPPAAAFARRPLRAVELGGYEIPKMTSIFVSPYITQRNRRYFVEPHAFIPGRWGSPPIERFAYFPFGGGSKMCIGEPFARLEATLAIATIAGRYALRRIDAPPIDPAAQAVMRPARPVLVTAVRR